MRSLGQVDYMDGKFVERLDLITGWILSFAFGLAMLSYLALGNPALACVALIPTVGLFPPLKFPLTLRLSLLAFSVVVMLLHFIAFF